MAERSKDWFVQAERDLEQAKSSQKEGRHEWACFAAQQSTGKAVKALSESFERRSVNWDLNGLPVSGDIIVYSLPEWEDLIKKDTKFSRMLKSEAVWTFSKQT